MFIEFQIDAAKFLTRFSRDIATANLCITDTFQLPGQSDTFLLDHLVVEQAFLQNSSGVIEVGQPIELYLTNLSELNTSQSNPPVSLAYRITLFFLLNIITKNDTPNFNVTFVSVNPGALPVDEPTLFHLLESQLPANKLAPIDLKAINHLVGETMILVNAGVGMKSDASLLAIRLEVDATDLGSHAAWDQFKMGAIDNHLLNMEWSLLLDGRLIAAPVTQIFVNAMSKAEQADKWNPKSDPFGWWDPLANIPRVTVSFSGEVPDACQCFLWSENISLDVTAEVVLSVPAADKLRSVTQISYDVTDEFDLFCCEFTTALAWWFFGANYLQKGKINWGEYLGGLALSEGVFWGAVFEAGNMKLKDLGGLNLPSECNESSDGNAITCTQAVSFPSNPVMGQLTLDTIWGLPDGPVLAGMLGTVFDPTPPVLAAIDVKPFTWSLVDSCDPNSGFQASALILIENNGGLPLHICQTPTVLDDKRQPDPLHQFQPFLTYKKTIDVGGVGEIRIVIPEKQVKSAYLKKPYNCNVLIQSDGGARLITIPLLMLLSAEEKQKMQVAAEVNPQCLGLPIWRAGTWNPKWAVDPGPEGKVVEHLWQFIVAGLDATDQIGVHDAHAQLLAAATPQAGVVQLSALTTPLTGGSELAITRSARAPATEQLAHTARSKGKASKQYQDHVVMMKQVALMQQAEVQLKAACRHLAADRLEGHPSLFVTTTSGLSVYDLTVPSAPEMIHQLNRSGLAGVMLLGKNLLAWGDRGLELLLRDLPSSARDTRPAKGKGVIKVVRSTSYLYALTNTSVDVYDRHLQKAGHVSISGAEHIAVTGRVLVVGDRRGLWLYDLSRPPSPRKLAFHAVKAVTDLSVPHTSAGQNLIFVGSAGGGGVFDLSDGGLTEITRYASVPWFVRAVETGKTLVRLKPDRKAIAIYTGDKALNRM
ncbi:MAG TPA: hypothetical protein VMP08_23460 [Anaerolineae bacterium]|nr:hypothetical protein [Anaerolineae bacterium]